MTTPLFYRWGAGAINFLQVSGRIRDTKTDFCLPAMTHFPSKGGFPWSFSLLFLLAQLTIGKMAF